MIHELKSCMCFITKYLLLCLQNIKLNLKCFVPQFCVIWCLCQNIKTCGYLKQDNVMLMIPWMPYVKCLTTESSVRNCGIPVPLIVVTVIFISGGTCRRSCIPHSTCCPHTTKALQNDITCHCCSY